MLSYVTDLRFIIGLLLGWLGVPMILGVLRSHSAKPAAA
jgi:hypothetical protein